MSHELTTHADGRVEFAYLASDGTPWHGLGQALEDGTSLDAWRVAAGMDWKIKRGIVRYNTDFDGSQLELPEQHVLFRSDTKAPLGVVSNRYQVVQPGDVVEFFRDIARAGGLELSGRNHLRWQALLGNSQDWRSCSYFSSRYDRRLHPDQHKR